MMSAQLSCRRMLEASSRVIFTELHFPSHLASFVSVIVFNYEGHYDGSTEELGAKHVYSPIELRWIPRQFAIPVPNIICSPAR